MDTYEFEELKRKIIQSFDIAQYIGKYTELNSNNMGLCVIHKDTKPSLKVYPETQSWYCFACGIGGDIITFYMHHFKKSFMEALIALANEAKISIPYISNSFITSVKERTAAEEILGSTAEFYHKNITPAVKKYLIENRGFTDELISKFKLGYASSGLKEHLLVDLGFDLKMCLKAGVLIIRKGQVLDYFYGRITFPSIRAGKVLHISARSFNGSQPKYLNLKGPIDYLYNEDALKNKNLILVEGVTDVITLTKYGFKAIALTTSNFQPKFVSKFDSVETLYVCLDGDFSGNKGALKVSELMPAKVKVIELPEGQDPSDYFKNHTKEDFDLLIKNAKDFTVKPTQESIDPTVRFDVGYFSNEILKKFHLIYDEYRRLWKYDDKNGIWIDGAESDVEKILRTEVLPKKYLSKHYVSETLEHIKGLIFDRGVAKEPPANLIAFNDKIYDLDNNVLKEFSPDYFFVNKLPVNAVTENKECPVIDKIFESFVGADKKDILYELSAYCLYRGYNFQKIFILIGDGGNGKSTFISILSKLIGKNNISSVSLKELVSNKFALSLLFKKLINFSGEIDNYQLKNTGILKQLSGGDQIKCEEKFKVPFFFDNYAKIIIATNKMPEILDDSEAFYRRIMYIRFPNRFVFGENANPKILEKITQQELEGYCYKCIQKLKELKDRGFVFSQYEVIDIDSKLYGNLASNIRMFLNIYTDIDAKSYILTSEFYDKFSKFADITIKELNRVAIGKIIKAKGYYKKTEGFKDDKGNRSTRKVFNGLRWKY